MVSETTRNRKRLPKPSATSRVLNSQEVLPPVRLARDITPGIFPLRKKGDRIDIQTELVVHEPDELRVVDS
jgi:hypothetical protein